MKNKFKRAKSIIMHANECIIDLNPNYIDELHSKFPSLELKRLKLTCGMFITSPENKSMHNDIKIFTETQVKRLLVGPLTPFVAKTVKSKLSYFSKSEEIESIYKFDNSLELGSDENFAIQNIGHATQLIQIPHFNILTDPIFYGMNRLLYPSKTSSYPSIIDLPRIDIVLISHNHLDHTDKQSLLEILSRHKSKGWSPPKAMVPIGDKALFQSFGFTDVQEVEWFTKIIIDKADQNTLSVVSIPSDHRSGRFGVDHHKSLVVGWIINPGKDVIFKYSGDTRALSSENQIAVDAVLWNEIKNMDENKGKLDKNVSIPDIICFEPSGPNYTRKDMDVTHQSTSYSTLLKIFEAKNLASLSNQDVKGFLEKIQTVMIHHNKFELGPDRFNEGLFIFKKLALYLKLSPEALDKEYAKQIKKLNENLDHRRLIENLPFTSRPLLFTLPSQTSLLVHAKEFVINDIKYMKEKYHPYEFNRDVIESVMKRTKFLKIGQRMNNKELASNEIDLNSIKKYSKKN